MDNPRPTGDTAGPDVGFALNTEESPVPDIGFSLDPDSASTPTPDGELPDLEAETSTVRAPAPASTDEHPARGVTGAKEPNLAGPDTSDVGSAGVSPARSTGTGGGPPGGTIGIGGGLPGGDELLPAAAGAPSGDIPDMMPLGSAAAEDRDVSELGAGQPEPDEAKPRELAFELARQLAAGAPMAWTRLDAVFALTTTENAARVFYTGAERIVEAVPSEGIMELARAQRDSTAGLDDGPWWRLILGLTAEGEVAVDYDYGQEPFPDEQLMSPEAYLDDLERYPRERLPVWLAAYIEDDGGQERDPEQAAFQENLDRAAGIVAEVSVDDLPPVDVMWARWVTLAAVFVASGSELGPRVTPALGWFEGATHSGGTLSLLPGGRAVLSGGVWEAPALDAAYNEGEDLPELYRGAPFWVADQVLNPRAAQGMLSFCYWWDGGCWYRGESPAPSEFARALPGVWTAEVVTGLIVRQLAEDGAHDELRSAAAALVTAAEARAVDRALIDDLLGDSGELDADGAYYQFFLGGLTAAEQVGTQG